MSTSTGRRASVVGALVALLHVWLLSPLTVDDAAITYAYAHRAAQGYPLGTVTPGRPIVEGYSNFTWTIILSAFDRIGIRPETARRPRHCWPTGHVSPGPHGAPSCAVGW